MNTTEKGTLFELRVLEQIKATMLKGEFLTTLEGCEIFHKKAYYSDKRKGDIIFDIAIECRRTPDKDPYLYILIECKDLGKPVPVDDMEEFDNKINQVTGKNVKGMFFSTNSFDRGAMNFAKSSGIAVVRMMDDDALHWLIERESPYLKTDARTAFVTNVVNALIEENFVSTRQSFFALVGTGNMTADSMLSLLLKAANTEASG
ncbi:MAG: restriction endonuclease [Bacteroidetes bacterium]|nr:restriction endonuclease [Bacteroidota bacterium]